MSSPAEVSVVIISHNEGEYLRSTVESFQAHLPPNSEIVVVDDMSTDGSCDFLHGGGACARVLRPETRLGAPAGRTFGALKSTGKVVVFSDAHVEVPPGWAEPLCDALSDPAVGLVGPVVSSLNNRSSKGFGRSWKDASLEWKWLGKAGTERYAVPFISGCFIAMRSELFREVGGFDAGLHIWGEEGAELCLRLWRMGYECQVIPNVDIAHLFRPTFPYQLDRGTLYHNRMRVAVLHFDDRRLERQINALRDKAAFPTALVRLMNSDVWQRRESLNTLCRRSGAEFFERFKIDALD